MPFQKSENPTYTTRDKRYEEYQKEYTKRTENAAGKKWLSSHNLFRFCLSFDRDKFPDVSDKLNSVSNKTAYIIELIRRDIAEGNGVSVPAIPQKAEPAQKRGKRKPQTREEEIVNLALLEDI